MTDALLPTWLGAIVDRGTAAALHLFVQSALLSALGLLAAWFCRRRGAALQSAVLRVTLAGVLFCPLLTLGLTAAGVQGFSMTWTGAGTGLVAVADASGSRDADLAAPQTRNQTDPQSGVRHATLAMETISAGTEPEFADPLISLRAGPAEGAVVVQDARDVATAPASAAVAAGRPPVSAPPAAGSSPPGSVQIVLAALCGAWAFGSLAFFARLLAAQIVIGRICRSARPAGPAALGLCGAICRRLGVATPRVLVSERIHSACLVGVHRPVVLLPSDDSASEEVLTHELAHLARRDALFLLLSRLATAVLFLQPLVWVLARKLEQTADEVCDDFVLQAGSDRKAYARTLIEVAEQWQADWSAATVGVGVVRFKSSLGRRVVRILDTSRSLSVRAGLRGMLFIAAIGACLTGTVALIGSEGGAGNAEHETTDQPATTPQREQTKSAATESSPTNDPESGKGDAADASNRLHYQGQVVTPDGKPAAGARIYFVYHAQPLSVGTELKPLAVTEADGRFDFTLAREDFDSSGEARTWRYAALVAVADGYGFAWSNSVAHETTGKAAADAHPQFRERFLKMLEGSAAGR